jgi:hypothetical protein
VIALLSLLLAQLAAPPAPALPRPAPPAVEQAFANGETLDYSLSWLRITAGHARMTIAPSVEDPSRYRMTSVGRSSSRFSRIFRVRDELETLADRQTFGTVQYRKKLDEQGRLKDELTTVANGIASRTTATKTKKTLVPVPVFDPVSLIHRLRMLDLTVGRTHTLPVLADGKLYSVTARVTGRETLATEAGTFRCVIIEPVMHATNNDARDSHLWIWYSDDERRLPVRIRTEVNAGTITATLRNVQRGVTSTDPPLSPAQ